MYKAHRKPRPKSKTSDISKQSPSPLHHTFLLGRARFTAQPLSALVFKHCCCAVSLDVTDCHWVIDGWANLAPILYFLWKTMRSYLSCKTFVENWSSGVEMPLNICTRFEWYLYSTEVEYWAAVICMEWKLCGKLCWITCSFVYSFYSDLSFQRLVV